MTIRSLSDHSFTRLLAFLGLQDMTGSTFEVCLCLSLVLLLLLAGLRCLWWSFFTADPFLLDAHIDVCTRASDPAISFIQEVSLRKKPAVRSGKAASKKPASMIHAGRFLLLKHRTSGQKAALPLQKRITKKGAPGPSESKDEVLPLLKTKLCSSKQIVGSDASKGLQGDYKEMNLTATTARHSAE